MIELVNHEAILAQTKEDMITERAAEIRHAIEKERTEFTVKFDQELQVARQMVEEKERELEIYRSREMSLIAECERYKNTISLLTESASQIGQTLSKKVLFFSLFSCRNCFFRQFIFLFVFRWKNFMLLTYNLRIK